MNASRAEQLPRPNAAAPAKGRFDRSAFAGRLLGIGLLGIGLLAVPVRAQESGASPNWRPGPPVVLGPADSLRPLPTDGTSEGQAQIRTVRPGDKARLRANDPDSTGALETREGGLGVAMWQGTPRSFVERLLTELPVRTPSPTLHALMRRLLLSTADSPLPADRSGQLTVLRAQRLSELGGSADLAALLAATPALAGDEGLLRAWTESTLLESERGPDCARLNDVISRFSGPFWRPVALLCQIRSGDLTAAALAADVMREQGETDETMLALVDVLVGRAEAKRISVPSLARATPLHFALMRQAGKPLPADALPPPHEGTPALWLAVARGAPADPLVQIAAAERAATTGTLRAEAVADAYEAAPFKPGELAALGKTPGTPPATGPRTRALLHRALKATADPAKREPLLRQALGQLDPLLAIGGVGAVPLRAADDLAPTANLSALAPLLARAYYAQGRGDEARPWYEAALRADSAARRLWPLVALHGTPETTPGLDGWLETLLPVGAGAGSSDDAAARTVASLLALLEGAGVAVPAKAWEHVATAAKGLPEPPRPDLWRRLGEAAANNRIGETVLLTLVLIGENGPQGSSPLAVARAATALRAVALDDVARNLLREAAVALIW